MNSGPEEAGGGSVQEVTPGEVTLGPGLEGQEHFPGAGGGGGGAGPRLRRTSSVQSSSYTLSYRTLITTL